MKEMQRWKVIDDDLMRPDEQPHGIVPDEVFLEVVLASDAESAIAAAEKRGREAAEAESLLASRDEAWEEGHKQGQRDMLAKCITAVEEIIPDDSDNGSWEATIAAAWLRHAVSKLRALEDKP